MGYTEDRIAEFKENARKASSDWEREHWETRLAHAKLALAAEKDAPPEEPVVIEATDDTTPKRRTRSAK